MPIFTVIRGKCDFPDFHVLHPYFSGAYVWYKLPCACDIWLYSSISVWERLARFLTMHSSTISREYPFSQWSEDKCDFPYFHVLDRYFSGAYAWYRESCACVIWLYSSMGVLEGLARFMTIQSSTISRECPFSQWSEDKCYFPDFHVLQRYFSGANAWYKESCACDIWLYSFMGVLEGLARFLTMQSSTISRECPFSQWSGVNVISLISTSCTHTFLGHMFDTNYHVRVTYGCIVPLASEKGLRDFWRCIVVQYLENTHFHSDPRINVISLISTSWTDTFLGHMLDTENHVRVSYGSTFPWAS
jgi:hypothetical protein